MSAGGWRTLESFWNVRTTCFFRLPAGAQIKIRYSGAFFGVDRQRQTLDGESVKRLGVGIWSLAWARVQILVATSTNVTYEVLPGDVARPSPEFHF